jgi:predicted dithiol-disulfide oxidoreductase (DUF899 family)
MTTTDQEKVEGHRVVPENEWIRARQELLAKEKAFTRARDELSRERRRLPWTKLEKPYVFEGPNGKETLVELFAGRSQLIVYHFMFAPEWKAGCKHCSFWADHFNPINVHLNQRDATLIAVSRAPFAKLEDYRKRMGWTFKWVSSYGSDFNFDLGVAFTPEQVEKKSALYNFTVQDPDASEREGVSVLYRDTLGGLFRTYSTYARGIDLLNTTYNFLDLVPKGRDEGDRGPYWLRRHDEYDPA